MTAVLSSWWGGALLVLLSVGMVHGASSTDDVRFQLRHRNTFMYPPSVMAYVDQPPRIQGIRLTWTPPGPAEFPELPAVYSALWVDETHPLAAQDYVRLLTRETPVWFLASDMAADTDPETFLRLYLAHDSVIWQRWTNLVLTYDQLHLTRLSGATYTPGPRALVWACAEYDTQHRCVVNNVTLLLMYNNARAGTSVVIPRVVLDWEAAQSQVPPWMYGGLQYGQLTSTSARLLAVKLATDTWFIREGDVSVDDTEPIIAAGMLNDTIVLGRRLLWRTFNVFSYDSRETGEWTLNRVLSGFDVLVQLLEVSVLFQSVLLAYEATGVYMLALDRIIRARGADLSMFDPHVLSLRDRGIIAASMALAVFQIVGSVVATGSGPYTDRDLTTALWRLAWVIVAVAGWQLLTGLVFFGLSKKLDPGKPRSILHVLAHATYIKLALIGELSAFLPDATQSKYFLLLAAFFTVIYVIPSFTYTTLCLLLTGAAHDRRSHYMWAAGIMELLATLTLDTAAVIYLFRPALWQHQVLWGTYAVWCMAVSAGCLALIIPTVVVLMQVYRGIVGHEKIKKL